MSKPKKNKKLNAETERLRSFIREIVAIDPKAGSGEAKYFVTADFIARARALVE